MDTVGAFQHQRALVAGFDIALDPVAKSSLLATRMPRRTEPDILEKKISTQPRGVGRREDKFKAPRFGGEEAVASLSRAAGKVDIEQDANQHANGIGGVEFLQEGDELTAAVALSDDTVDNAGHDVDGCREDLSSKPFVFVVALDSSMVPRLGWQIGAVVAIA